MTKEEKRKLDAKIDSVITEEDKKHPNAVRYAQIEYDTSKPRAFVRVFYDHILNFANFIALNEEEEN